MSCILFHKLIYWIKGTLVVFFFFSNHSDQTSRDSCVVKLNSQYKSWFIPNFKTANHRNLERKKDHFMYFRVIYNICIVKIHIIIVYSITSILYSILYHWSPTFRSSQNRYYRYCLKNTHLCESSEYITHVRIILMSPTVHRSHSMCRKRPLKDQFDFQKQPQKTSSCLFEIF